MTDQEGIPRVDAIFDTISSKPSRHHHREILKSILKEILPEGLFETKSQGERAQEVLRKKFLELVPLVKSSGFDETPTSFSLYCLFPYRSSASKFFYDLVVQWLIPGKRLDIALIYAVDFRIPLIGEDVFTLCEIIIQVHSQEELDAIRHNLPLIETELRLGVNSDYYARRILEIKGASPDVKTSMIQQHVAALVKRMPKAFSKSVFTEMQHILVLCHEDFKAQRSISHLTRMIGGHYLFRKQLLQHVQHSPNKRHVAVKIFKTTVQFPAGPKRMLAVMVGLNFLREKEVFEQRNLLKAIKKYVPSAEAIDQTFFSNRKRSEHITTIYVEIEKSDGKEFTSEEIRNLRTQLPNDLQSHIGQLMLPVFMPRNEEEVMRNILSLSNQIKYLRDIPQVYISFDEQTDRNLFFTIIFVRILQGGEKSIQDLIRGGESFLRYMHDRCKIVGSIRKKYPKEATVFRVKFPKDTFLRGDHSIDLYKARQAVVNELGRILGEFRDFNGGMISKQNELLSEVRTHLAKESARYSEILLENFFYSLAPVIMRTVLEPHAFKSLFQMLLQQQETGIPGGQKCSLKIKYEPDFSYVMMTAPTRTILDEISKSLMKFHQTGSDLVQGYVKTPGHVTMGYIYRCVDVHKQAQFRQAAEAAMQAITGVQPK